MLVESITHVGSAMDGGVMDDDLMAGSEVEMVNPIVERARFAMAPNEVPFDMLEKAMAESGLVVEPDPIEHEFTRGLYIRKRFLAKGRVVTSKIHKTQHPYTVMSGIADVWIDGIGWTKIEAPYIGLTVPGTRRLLLIQEDMIWITFHPNPTNERNLDRLEEMLFFKHDSHLPKEVVCPVGR